MNINIRIHFIIRQLTTSASFTYCQSHESIVSATFYSLTIEITWSPSHVAVMTPISGLGATL